MEITAYVVHEGRFSSSNVASPDQIPTAAVWIDVQNPTIEEVAALAERLGLRFEIDERARQFDVYGHVEVEDEQLTVLMIAGRPQALFSADLGSTKVLILMSPNQLVTFRLGSAPGIERTARDIAGIDVGPQPHAQLLIAILSGAIHTTSTILDAAEAEVRRRAHSLFNTDKSDRAEINLENLLSELGPWQARMIEVVYGHNVIARTLTVLENDPKLGLSPELKEDVALMQADVVSLKDFAASVDDQLARLVDATIGYIGIRQNDSTRLFSIIATIFMPPTLLAAVWGMNFQFMPELDDKYGYAFALTLIVLSATIPLWVARKMGLIGR